MGPASRWGRWASAATLTRVTYPNDASSKVEMYAYVPDKVVDNPPLVVVIHSCQSTAQTYFQNSKIPWKKGSDGKGYISKLALAPPPHPASRPLPAGQLR